MRETFVVRMHVVKRGMHERKIVGCTLVDFVVVVFNDSLRFGRH